MGSDDIEPVMSVGNAAREQDAERSSDRISVFVSYSRTDLQAAENLRISLIEDGFDAYLDKHDILPGEPWRDRLAALIEAAESVVFLISPASLASDICDWEANEAERLGKRILPVVLCDLADRPVPGRLKRLNYIFMRHEVERRSALVQLSDALKTDINWVREHTRLGGLANDWERAGRVPELLLRASALLAAEEWLSQPVAKGMMPTGLHREFVAKSRANETVRLESERAQIERTRRFQKMATWGLMGVALLVIVLAVGSTWQARSTALREGIVLTSLAQKAYDAGQYHRAMRIAVHGLPPRGALPYINPWSRELERVLAQSAQRVPDQNLSGADALVKDRTSRYVAVSYRDEEGNRVGIWDRSTAEQVVSLADATSSPYLPARLSPDETLVAAAFKGYFSGKAGLWRRQDGSLLMELDADTVEFSPDSKWLIAQVFSGEFASNGALGVGSFRLWSIVNNTHVAYLSVREYSGGESGDKISFVWSPSANRLLVMEQGHAPVLWNVGNDGSASVVRVLEEISTRRFLHAEFSPTGKQLYIASTECSNFFNACSRSSMLELWDANDGHMLTELLRVKGTDEGGEHVLKVAFSSKGDRIAVIGRRLGRETDTGRHEPSPTKGGGAVLYALEAHREIARIEATAFTNIAFSNSGERVSIWEEGMPTRVLDANTGAQIMALDNAEGEIAFGPIEIDRMLVFGSKGGRLLRYSNGEVLNEVPGAKETYLWSDGMGSRAKSQFDVIGKRFLLETENGFQIRYASDGSLVASRRGQLMDWRGQCVLSLFEPDQDDKLEKNHNRELQVIDLGTGEVRGAIRDMGTGLLAGECDRVLTVEREAIHAWHLKWSQLKGQDLRDAICGEKLLGETRFTPEDIQDPALADLSGTDPCDAIGTFSLQSMVKIFGK